MGTNFIPSTAINQLEMWQAATFDTATIRRELGWAADLGMNLMRVYLHDLLWEQDSAGLVARMDRYLAISSELGIKTMFVLFDDCWYGNAQPGPQQVSTDPGMHNNYWLQSPRFAEVMDESAHPRLERYTKGVMRAFGQDPRVALWDIYNEPGNNHLPEVALPLLKKVMTWARETQPSQPLTTGVWRQEREYWEMMLFQIENSDILTFHAYNDYEGTKNHCQPRQLWQAHDLYRIPGQGL
ncbi:MAG: cellulase family glycosylhydrolase [Cytophagales bacterium]|nr:cellulase family glycosylhydrolase [Cytophagales bacterium]